MATEKAIAATSECLGMMAEAKSTLVSIDGIGSELLPALVAWVDDKVIGYAILQNPFMTGKMIHTALTLAAGMMVSGWHADALAVTMEGYVEEASPFDGANEDGPSLASRFPTDPSIQEALWVAYASRSGDACMGVSCFTQGVGRVVRFEDPTFSRPDQLDDFNQAGSIPGIVKNALMEIKPTPFPKGTPAELCRKRMAIEIHQLGFSVYLDGNEPWIAQFDDAPSEDTIIPDHPDYF